VDFIFPENNLKGMYYKWFKVKRIKAKYEIIKIFKNKEKIKNNQINYRKIKLHKEQI